MICTLTGQCDVTSVKIECCVYCLQVSRDTQTITMFSFLAECPDSQDPISFSPIYLTSNLLLAAGLLIPQSSPSCSVALRLFLSLSHMAACVWALIDLCSIPVFCWHAVLMLISLAKFSEILWRCWPASVPANVMGLYSEVLLPLGVSKEDMVLLLRDSRIEDIKEEGAVWAREGTMIEQSLSMLLAGRMVVKTQDYVLHKIEPSHFLQSVEWAARRHSPEFDHFQVQIQVEEAPCRILHFSSGWLVHLLEVRPDLGLLMECLVGKDVSLKLYMMNKIIGDTDIVKKKPKLNLFNMKQESHSMDAINTGWKGLMRSHCWTDGGPVASPGILNRGVDTPPPQYNGGGKRSGSMQHTPGDKLYWPSGAISKYQV